jgi:radical SAM protein
MTGIIAMPPVSRHPFAQRFAMQRLPAFDFGHAPFLVIWETTRACALACVHCRADAIPRRDPRELTTEDGFRLIDQVVGFGDPPPLFVLTGGDPMRRPDLVDLVRYASTRGLVVAMTPSGTAAVTRARLRELKDAGLSRIAISLDGADAETHDAFRGVRGSFDWTMKIVTVAQDLGLPLQINSTVSRITLPSLEALAKRVRTFNVALWAIFFLVRTGRGASLEQVSAEQCERVLTWLYDLSLTAPFGIKTTEAPHFHRVIWQRDRELGANLVEQSTRRRSLLRSPRSVNDGNGFVFVDHLGDICPSGFLPVCRGNVKTDDLVAVYRDDEIFQRLRNPGALMGKCGRCEFREVCGGSRARAYAATGSLVASDPLCAYDPGPSTQPPIARSS